MFLIMFVKKLCEVVIMAVLVKRKYAKVFGGTKNKVHRELRSREKHVFKKNLRNGEYS